MYSNRTELKNTTYYSIIVFKHADNTGTHIKNEYKRKSSALKKFNQLASSGLYEYMTLREEKVFFRDASTEISSSCVVKKWGAA